MIPLTGVRNWEAQRCGHHRVHHHVSPRSKQWIVKTAPRKIPASSCSISNQSRDGRRCFKASLAKYNELFAQLAEKNKQYATLKDQLTLAEGQVGELKEKTEQLESERNEAVEEKVQLEADLEVAKAEFLSNEAEYERWLRRSESTSEQLEAQTRAQEKTIEEVRTFYHQPLFKKDAALG